MLPHMYILFNSVKEPRLTMATLVHTGLLWLTLAENVKALTGIHCTGTKLAYARAVETKKITVVSKFLTGEAEIFIHYSHPYS